MDKTELKEIIKADLVRFNNRRPNIKDWLLCNEAWYIYNYIKHMRYIEYYREKGPMYKLCYLWHFLRYKRIGFRLHYEIYPGTVGPGFRIYHVGGFTHIGGNVHIGKNCTLQPGAVFGNKTETEDDRPVNVGDNCYIGLDAKILGSVTIGNNVTIGANSVVTKDIPDNAIVGGIPAKIIRMKNTVK